MYRRYHECMLKIEIENSAAQVCASCQGDLVRGANLERLRELVLSARGKTVVLDLKGVERMDAYGIGVVAAMAESIREHGSALKVVHASGQMRELFQTCGLESLLDDGAGARSSAA